MKKQRQKRGELTTTQLVTIIILIVSFVIILFLLFRLNLGKTTDKEICRNSVVLKEKTLLGGSLDCKTNYLCISGGENCGGTNFNQIKVNSSSKDEIMKTIANEMADCWFEFGEGNINYGGGITSTSTNYAICSIISFDKKVQEKVSEISYQEFYSFLSKENKSGADTYLQYLYDINDVHFFIPQEQVKVNISQDKTLTNQEYSIITGIDNHLGGSYEILKVYIIPTSETQSRTTSGSKEFITKS